MSLIGIAGTKAPDANAVIGEGCVHVWDDGKAHVAGGAILRVGAHPSPWELRTFDGFVPHLRLRVWIQNPLPWADITAERSTARLRYAAGNEY